MKEGSFMLLDRVTLWFPAKMVDTKYIKICAVHIMNVIWQRNPTEVNASLRVNMYPQLIYYMPCHLVSLSLEDMKLIFVLLGRTDS